MRERSQVQDTQLSHGGEAYQEINGTPTGVTMTTPSLVTQEVVSTIRDHTNGRGWKTCEHSRVWNYTQPGSDDTYYLRSNPSQVVTWRGPNSYWSNWDVAPPHFGVGSFVATFPKSESSQLSETLDRFYSDDNVNNILNVVEMPELPKSLNSLKESLEEFKQARYNLRWAPVLKESWAKYAKAGAAVASKGLLTYSFGIAPLLADMMKTAKVCSNYRDELKRYLKSAGRVEIVRTALSGDLAHPHPDNASIPSAGYLTYKGQTLRPPTRVISVRGLRRHLYGSSLFQEMDFVATRLLGRGPFNFAWERIPFSFVVDWFADLRTFTGALDSLIVGKAQQITGQISTIQWAAQGSAIHFDGSAPYHDQPYDGASMSGSRVSYYHRKVLPFNPLWVGASGRFGKKQLALTGALLHESILAAKRRSR